MQDATIWAAYGCPFDARSVLPAREYQAHLAILRGQAEGAKEERRKMKKGLV